MSNVPTKFSGENGATIGAYVTGYAASIALSVMAYLLVRQHSSGKTTLIILVISLAMIQCITQLRFFLHLGRETRPRWKLLVFLLMLMVVCILVFGSLWIMSNLNKRMTPQQMETYMKSQDAL